MARSTAARPERLTSFESAANYADVSTRSIRRWIAAGLLPGYRVGPRLVKGSIHGGKTKLEVRWFGTAKPQVVIPEVLGGQVMKGAPAGSAMAAALAYDAANPLPPMYTTPTASPPGLPSLPSVPSRPSVPSQPDEAADTERELRRLRVREAARIAFAAEQGGGTEPPARTGLDAFLAVPDEPVRYRVDGLWPAGGRVIGAAQFKAGKSVLNHNLIRSLADGTPFLGHFPVTPPEGRIVLLDLELYGPTLRRWLRDQGIENTGQVDVIPVRGRVASLAILDPTVRTAWAKELRAAGAAVVILDCLRPALDAFGLDENKDAGRWLIAFDAMLADAGVSEALVTHHMGHAGERTRGDSRLRDWPDAEWRLVRQQPDDPGEQPDPSAPRFLTAYGRDVDVPEGALSYDEATRRLTFVGGNRRDARNDLPTEQSVAVVVEQKGLTGNSVDHRLQRRGLSRRRSPTSGRPRPRHSSATAATAWMPVAGAYTLRRR